MSFGRWIKFGALGAAVLLSGSAFAQKVEKPQYGGTLEIATIFAQLSALSWDHKDWPWKINHDAGGTYENLLTADLSKGTRAGGKYAFVRRRLDPDRRHQGRARRELGGAEGAAGRHLQAEERASCFRPSPASWRRAS